MGKVGQRGPYAKTEQVRQHIVAACVEVFAESGYQAATIAEVARRAGVSHNGLLHHFPTKEDLLLAVIELRDRQIAEGFLNADRTPSESDFRYSLADRKPDGSSTGTPLGLMELDAVLSGEASVAEHPAHAALAKRYAGMRSFYARMLQRFHDEGRLKVDVEPQSLAVILLAVNEGLHHQWHSTKRE